jgi:hypothetical protein
MDPCTQTDRIGRIEEAVNGISAQVSALVTEFQVLKGKVEPVLAKVEEHDTALYGSNGNVGIVSDVARVSKALDVLDELNGALKGVGDKPGLISVISTLSEQMKEGKDTNKWVSRVVLGWVIATTLGGIYYLFLSHPLAVTGVIK